MTKVAIIGAGIGGLVAALLLSHAGHEVAVCEAAATPGGKLREVAVGSARIDAGPTVFTLRPIFEAIFASAGEALGDHLTLEPLDRLARHVWDDGARLDLFSDAARNAEAIGAFAGPAAAEGYRKFAAKAGRIFELLDQNFMQIPQPGLAGLLRRGGPALAGISPFASLWSELGQYFATPRLRQLFARYATYCGASPFLAPATLMLIAHAEQLGVWRVAGGMYQLALALERLARARGAAFHYGAPVAEILVHQGRAAGVRLADGEVVGADAIIANVDVGALDAGLFGIAARNAVAGMMKGAAPSLSAMTWAVTGTATGYDLAHHNVVFSENYPAEFIALAERRLPPDPTVYICAPGGQKYFLLVNAAAGITPSPEEAQQCLNRTLQKLRNTGLTLTVEASVFTGPAQFAKAFPGTGGALYGRSLEGWRDSFARPGAVTKLPGLYLAGGAVHPGPGLPMAAISGRIAAASVSTFLSKTGAMPGGMSTRSAMTAPMR
jgi:1-hydroxycarotenoid 3,4-desaturase